MRCFDLCLCRMMFTVLLVLFIFSTLPGVAQATEERVNVDPDNIQLEQHISEEIMLRAKVLKVEQQQTTEDLGGFFGGQEESRQLVTIEITSQPFQGQVMQIPHIIVNQPKYDIRVNPGDKVILFCELVDGQITSAFISDYARDTALKYLLLAFAAVMIIFGGIKGFKSLISLAVTGVAIIFVLLPAILAGYNPIMLTILTCAVVTAITLVLIGGISIKTISAFIGTVGGVIIAGILAVIAGTAAQLTGFSEDEMYMLQFIPQGVDFDYRGLLFAGMIIGALGAVMDVGMSIASALEEIKKANRNISVRKLITAGMNVGRDIMGTMSNTLILAYTGSALPLMLVFMAHDIPYLKIINLDVIATEVVRALAGSIGLIISVPITAVVAGVLFYMRDGKAKK